MAGRSSYPLLRDSALMPLSAPCDYAALRAASPPIVAVCYRTDGCGPETQLPDSDR